MVLTSIVECIQSEGVIRPYTSWINSLGLVTRIGVNQGTIELIESRFIDGRIYCKIRRNPLITVDGVVIDLANEKHYLLLAGGTELFENSVGGHEQNRGATDNRLSLTTTAPPNVTPPPTPLPPSDNEIYNGCGTQKLCFGMPDGCVSTRNCELMSATRRVNGGNFEFELLSYRK